MHIESAERVCVAVIVVCLTDIFPSILGEDLGDHELMHVPLVHHATDWVSRRDLTVIVDPDYIDGLGT